MLVLLDFTASGAWSMDWSLQGCLAGQSRSRNTVVSTGLAAHRDSCQRLSEPWLLLVMLDIQALETDFGLFWSRFHGSLIKTQAFPVCGLSLAVHWAHQTVLGVVSSRVWGLKMCLREANSREFPWFWHKKNCPCKMHLTPLLAVPCSSFDFLAQFFRFYAKCGKWRAKIPVN